MSAVFPDLDDIAHHTDMAESWAVRPAPFRVGASRVLDPSSSAAALGEIPSLA